MKITSLDELGLTITQAAYWLDVEPRHLARSFEDEELPQWLGYSLTGMEKDYREDPEVFQYYRLGEQLKERNWSSETALAAIPVLIEQAQKGKPISYGDLDEELRRRNPSRKKAGLLQKYGKPLGIIGEVIEEIWDEAADKSSPVTKNNALMPPLEALVVRGRGRLPGKGIDGFLVSYLRLVGESAPEDLMLLNRDREAVVERIHADIFGWADWSVLEKLAERYLSKRSA